MKFNREMLLLYAVTDRRWVGRKTLYEQVEEALDGGVTMVQLREKALDIDSFIEEAFKIKTLCKRYDVPLIINDNVEVALMSGADGVHVGIEDESISKIRDRVGSDFIIGATAKTTTQAVAVEHAGADYLGIGAVFPSPTKKNAIRLTIGDFKEIKSSVTLPAVAIGGIELHNICELKGSGADGIAVVSAIFSSENIKMETEKLRRKVINVLHI